MATISAKFGELLGLPEPSARFLLALFSSKRKGECSKEGACESKKMHSYFACCG